MTIRISKKTYDSILYNYQRVLPVSKSLKERLDNLFYREDRPIISLKCDGRMMECLCDRTKEEDLKILMIFKEIKI